MIKSLTDSVTDEFGVLFMGKRRGELKGRAAQDDVDENARMLRMYKKYAEDEDESAKPFVDRHVFNLGIGFVIITNAIFIGLDMDRSEYGMEDSPIWYASENLFCSIFFIEMLLKIKVKGFFGYISDSWNFADFVLVWMAVADTWVMQLILRQESSMLSLTTLRILRMMRMARLVRLLHIFKELWLIVHGLMESMKTLFWVMLLLTLFLYLTGIFMTMTVGMNDEIYDDYKKLSGGWDHEEMFGTIPRSMLTLFQVLTLENWSTRVARHVISNQPEYSLFFFAFIMLTTYGLMNLVLGVIVEGTLAEAKLNTEKVAQKNEAERERTLEYLREIFEEADQDKSGSLDIEEFRNAMDDPVVQRKLRLIEVPVSEAEELFRILDADGEGSLSIDEFIGGCLRLKGEAKSKDLLAVQMSVECLAQIIDDAEASLTMNEQRMQVLDKITLQMERKYERAIENQHERMQNVLQAADGPVIMKKSCEKGPSGTANKPNLPPFPGFLQ